VNFVQETGFTCELDQLENGQDIDALTRCVEEACWRDTRTEQERCGCARVRWGGSEFLVWYCANGDMVTLRSIVAACP
jgi:hypothetical protein